MRVGILREAERVGDRHARHDRRVADDDLRHRRLVDRHHVEVLLEGCVESRVRRGRRAVGGGPQHVRQDRQVVVVHAAVARSWRFNG